MIRRLLPLTMLVAMFAALAIPGIASAKTKVAVGIGDQSPRMFSDKNYQALKLKKARYFIEWNAADQPAQLKAAAEYVKEAKAHKVKVLMHISTDDINKVPPSKLPSVAQYKSKVGKLIKLFKPAGVTEWGVWNEANHKSQPTSKNPKRAADFYKAMKSMCKGCKIVALDVLDQAGVEKYVKRWLSAAGSAGRTAKVIGIHNYSQVNRRITEKNASNRYPGYARILKAVRTKNKVAKMWLTETGGLASFGNAFKCNKSRQSSRTKYMFDLIKKYDSSIERLYSYNWFGNGCQAAFDGGLVEANGTKRSAYTAFQKGLKNAQR